MTILEQPPPSTAAPALGKDASRTGRLSVPSAGIALLTAAVVWIGITTLERSGSLGTSLAAGWAEIAAPLLFAMVGALLVCERLGPAERRKVFARGHIHDACYFAFHLVAVVPLMTILGVAFAYLLGTLPHWGDATWTASWPLWSVVSLTLVLMDGCNWAAHWADHRFGWLWRMHALHHTQQEVNVLTSFRAHPLSHLMGFFLATFPVLLLMGDRPLAPILITLYICLSTVSHANVPWTFGPLGRLFVSPAYHRVHHSIDDSKGMNLGIALTIWDVLARRAVFPQPGESLCRTGVNAEQLVTEQTDQTTPHLPLMLTQLLEPFRSA